MSDQHAAAAVTAVAVIAAILVARATVLHQGRHRRGTGGAHRPSRPHRHSPWGTGQAAPAAPAPSAPVTDAVREAEAHVHRCWQQLKNPANPLE